MREHENEREPMGRPAGGEAAGRPEEGEPGREWADQAAQARTGDDPRAVAPRDSAGRPTTGSSTGRRK
jgi:hypothetical protein